MTTLNLGDSAWTDTPQGRKRIRITGYWRFQPFKTTLDADTHAILQAITEQEIANGAPREMRIEPCTQDAAHLVGSNNGFHDVLHTQRCETAPAINVDFYQHEHTLRLQRMAKDGEMGLYGRIKLPVERYPRFFTDAGELRPAFTSPKAV